jgi:holo-[acyl-carrier protein] synthase
MLTIIVGLDQTEPRAVMSYPPVIPPSGTDALRCPSVPDLNGTRLGIDIVQISRIQASIDAFGQRFLDRLFTEAEIGYSTAVPNQAAERFAARFAAKEAAIKAFNWSEAGIDWRDVEVRKQADGGCHLALHRRAAALAGPSHDRVPLSLSHDGDYATAVVAVRET